MQIKIKANKLNAKMVQTQKTEDWYKKAKMCVSPGGIRNCIRCYNIHIGFQVSI